MNTDIKIEIPSGAKYIISVLADHGFEAFVVGGCVRDSLLGKTPNDWDITTSAKPEEVKALFSRTIDTGIAHGTVTVLVPREYVAFGNEKTQKEDYAFEVTTYRVDGKYEDHRRPKDVTFTACLEEDLKRRDFTINAMAYNDEQGIVDLYDGIKHLKEGVIQCVGNPTERFDEDALRILRAVRFAAQLDFVIEDATKVAMSAQAKFLKEISAERIQVELTKLITSKHPEKLVEAYELGLTAIILPEFDVMMKTEQNNPYHCYSVGMHTIRVMENVPCDMVLRYAALLHDVAKPACKTTDENGIDHFHGHQQEGQKIAKTVLRRLKLDNHTIDRVTRLVLYHDYGINQSEKNMKVFRRFLAKLGTEHFLDYIIIRKADMAGQSDYRFEERKLAILCMEEMFAEVCENMQCISLAELAIGGKDLIEMGMKPGKEMGEMLHNLLEMVLDEPSKNDADYLRKVVQERLNA